jgi:hypothetical protein
MNDSFVIEIEYGSSEEPYLSIVTRCYQRPIALGRNKQSIRSQTSNSWEQILLIDNVGRGIPAANKNIGVSAKVCRGQYVMVLDDDDMFRTDDAISSLMYATRHNPTMCVFKCDHCSLGILPSNLVWRTQRPIMGQIGMPSWIIRQDVWAHHALDWKETMGGDFYFLDAVWEDTSNRVWLDEVLTNIQQIGRGMPE